MPIYSDAIGNKYIGDCIWANHNIDYPNQKYLLSSPHSTISADIASLATDAGLLTKEVVAQSFLNNLTNGINLVNFGVADDINSRYIFRINSWNGNISTNAIYVYGNAGNNITGNTSPTGQAYISTIGFNSQNLITSAVGTATLSEPQWFGSSNGNYLCLGVIQKNYTLATNLSPSFWWAGKLLDVNTEFGYYSANYLSGQFTIQRLTLDNTRGSHYIAAAGKAILTTGRAVYDISCSDGQTPGSQWATDMWVYDNNTTLGFPLIGRVPSMLLGIGSYTYLNPVKIQGSVFPDNGSPWYLPVGTFAGKTLLTRCYSSVA